MEITVKMQDVLNFREAVAGFREKKLPLAGAYKLTKINNALDKDYEFYSNRFQEIIEKYAKKDADGNYEFSEDNTQILIQEDKLTECNDELEALSDLDVTVDNMDLTIENFGDIECTPAELDNIMPFLN